MERCGFFNANLVDGEYDRTYLADQFAAYFASFIGNGVYAKKSSELKVSEMTTQGMGIVVKSGQAWINGYWYENTEDKEFTIDAADGTLKRIDSVVLRWGATERSMWLQVNKGTPAVSPVAPVLVRSADYYDLQLATIYVDRAAIKITQSAITDTRANTSVCGWVTGVVDQIDTTELFNQFETYFQEFKDGNEADFNAWFDTIKGILDKEAAGNLYNMITAETERATEAEETNANLIQQLNAKVVPFVQHIYQGEAELPAGGNITSNVFLQADDDTKYLTSYIPLCVREWGIDTSVEGSLEGIELKGMVFWSVSGSPRYILRLTFQNNYTKSIKLTYKADVLFVTPSLFTHTGDIGPF